MKIYFFWTRKPQKLLFFKNSTSTFNVSCSSATPDIEECTNFGCLPSYLGRLPSYLGRLPLSVNLTSTPTYHLTTANYHSQPSLHNFGWRTKTTISLLEQIYYRKHKKYFDRPRSDFILEIDHYMFWVFGHKYDKESPCKWVLVNSQFLCFGHFTTPC